MVARTRIAVALIAGVIAACSGPARADGISLDGGDAALLQFGVGGYDVLHNYTAGMFRGEYRFASKLTILTPLVGAEVTTDGGLYGYGGFGLDVYLGDSWVLTPTAAVGAWYRGDGKELGSAIEFRTGAEFDYRFEDHARLGFSFHHISNAGIGKHNPGEEEMLAIYSIPLNGP